MIIKKIISGGQTGADRAALDWAIANNIPHSGYCPKGRIAEDGVIDMKYNLTETKSVNYSERTELNIQESDGTVIFSVSGVLSGGSKDTAKYAKKKGKPLLLLRKNMDNCDAELRSFVQKKKIDILNIAGPRLSKEPEIYQFVMDVLGAGLK